MNTVSLRQTLTVVVMFVIVSVGFILLDRRDALEPVRSGLSQVLSPIARAFYDVAQGPENRSELEAELARVTAERDELRAENARLEAEADEAATLRQQLEVQEARPDLTLVAARVIGGDPTGSQYFVVIDKGTADGIVEGMAVVDPHYYVGQVVEADEHTAKVMLIIDTSAQVGAQLQESDADGVVYGRWNVGGRLVMEHIDQGTEIRTEEWVLTSALASTQTRQVPPNIPIGYVIGEPMASARTDELRVDVQPAADFDDLDIVWIAIANDS